MGKIVISFEDTPQMREVLGQLSAHAWEDEAPFFRDDGLDDKPDEAMAKAYEAFHDAVVLAIYPETREIAREVNAKARKAR